MLYFTLYQLRQDTEMEEGDSDQRRHNIDDLLDLSTRCEPLLALSLQQSRTDTFVNRLMDSRFQSFERIATCGNFRFGWLPRFSLSASGWLFGERTHIRRLCRSV